MLSSGVQIARPANLSPGTTATVSDALRLALPAGTRIVQGHLQRPISWVRSFITRPWAIGNIEEGTLVILSLRGLAGRSEMLALPRLTEALATAGVSAILLSDELPPSVGIVDMDPELPILVLPEGAVLQEVERSVISLIVDRDGQVQRRALEIYQRLIQQALDDSSTQGMAETLAQAAGRVVYLENEYGIRQAVAIPPDREVHGLPTEEETHTLYSARDILGVSAGAPAASPPSGPIRRILGDHEYAVCSSPISLSGTIAGFLTLLGRTPDMQDLDEQIVVRAASAFAVPIAKQRAIMETQTRLQGSFLENLFTGTFADEEEIAARARYLGHDLRELYDTACVTLDEPTDVRHPIDEAQRAGVWTSFLDIAHREILEQWPRALLRERGDVLAVLIPVRDPAAPSTIRAQLEALRAHLGSLVGGVAPTIGLGRRAAGPRAIVRSYTEAERAARIGRHFLGGNQTIAFEDLGVYRVIARVEDRDTLESFRREYLGPLEEYDDRHAAELVDTLEGFFSCNGNHARAAEQLHLHRNTLLYRLDRIQALTGRDLSDSENRLSLQLALKIRRVFPTLQASQPRISSGEQR